MGRHLPTFNNADPETRRQQAVRTGIRTLCMKRKALAGALECNPQSIQSWLTGRRKTQLLFRRALARVMRERAEYLMRIADEVDDYEPPS